MAETLEVQALRRWIGREEVARACVDFELIRRFRATFDLTQNGAAPGGSTPPGLHWCLAPQVKPTGTLGPDGHPARGGFLPPVPLPRRMWAGGTLDIERPLCGGDEVHRTSRVEDVTVKEGRTGPLCFVTVTHVLMVGTETVLRERQDIVYRGADRKPMAEPAATSTDNVPARPVVSWERTIDAHPTLLFRYSALTFNGHRIHYDRRYCMEDEGYPGLVVHGPLQATLLLQLASEIGAAVPKRFIFRSEAPLFDGAAIHLHAEPSDGGLLLRTADAAGRLAMRAEASW